MILPQISSKTRFKKPVALLVAISFIFSNIALADISKTTNLDTKKPVEITTDPAKIVIPRDYGLIKSKYTAKDSKKLVIHIQDAHCNYEAQSNIIKILECLIKNDGLSLISVEGADGFIDTSWFKAFPDADIRKEVADYFMKKGEITGPEFLSITSEYRIKLFGAETRAYYIENLNAFTSSYPLKEDVEKYFNQIKAVLNKLKNYIYSDELKELDTKNLDYESKKLSFTDYVKYLESLGEKYKMNLRQYENLFKLVSVLVYEKKIDFNVVDKERAALIDVITKKLEKEALAELVNKSLEFKVGKISSAEYYDYLKALAAKHGISMSGEYPNLFNYIIYNSVYSRIENEQLFSDIKKFEGDVKNKIFANDDQRTLDKLSCHINILLGLVNIRLLNGDFDYYKSRRDEFTHEIFAEFIKKMAQRYGFAYEVDAPSPAVTESMPKLEDFYSIAIKRDKALVDNTIQAMRKEDAQVSVLITGGFHSEGITKLLEKQGISYIVVCPNITKDVETPYIKILTNQRTPLEEILADTGATTADAKNVKSGMLAPYLITAARINNIKEIADRTEADLKEWARMNMAPWIPTAQADLEKMKIRPTAAILAARFNRDVDAAVERYIASNKLEDRELKALRKSAGDVKKLAKDIIAELMNELPRNARKKDTTIREKTVGATLTDETIDTVIRDPKTKKLVIFEKGKVPEEIMQKYPDYVTIVTFLKKTIAGLDEGVFAKILASEHVSAEPDGPMALAFTKENLLKALDNLKIVLVQPKSDIAGIRIPGIVMTKTGSNFGHYSTKNDALYCAWGLIDILQSEGTVDAQNKILGIIVHELTEYTVLKIAFPGKVVIEHVVGTESKSHFTAQLLEIEIAGRTGRDREDVLGPHSALDDTLEDLTDEYFKTKANHYARANAFRSKTDLDGCLRKMLLDIGTEGMRRLEAALRGFRTATDPEIRDMYKGQIDQAFINRFNKIPVPPENLAKAEPIKIESDINTDSAKDLVLEGGYVPEFFFAGAATRLSETTRLPPQSMYAVDIWAVAGAMKKRAAEAPYSFRPEDFGLKMGDITGMMEYLDRLRKLEIPYYCITGLGMGPRQLIQYRALIKELAGEKGKDDREVLAKQKVIIHINEADYEVARNDLLINGFYGFKPENVLLTIVPIHKGYSIDHGYVVTALESDELPYGHGSPTMQLCYPERSFTLDRVGNMCMIGDSLKVYLGKLGVKVVVAHRINDLTKFSEEVIDLQSLAKALQLGIDKEGGVDVVVELVGNPDGQKGGNWIMDRRTGKKFLLEKVNATTPELLELLTGDYNAFRNIYSLRALDTLGEEGLPLNMRFKNGYLYFEAVSGDITQLNGIKAESVIRPGELIQDFKELKNIFTAVEFLRKQDKEAHFVSIARGVDAQHNDRMRAPSSWGVGSIRANGGAYTAQEHGTRVKGHSLQARKLLELTKREGTINGAVARKVDNGEAYAVSLNGEKLPFDKEIPLADMKNQKMRGLKSRLDALGINYIVLKGSKDGLPESAKDHIHSYGVTRKSVYIFEDDFNYLFSLSNGVDIIMEGATHEKAHIDNELANLENPEVKLLSESEIERKAPSQNVRFTLAMRNISEIANKLGTAKTPDELKALISEIRDINLWANYVTPADNLKGKRDELFIARSDIARKISMILMADQQKNKALLSELLKQAISDMASHIDILVNNGKMTKSQGEVRLSVAINFLKEWMEPKNGIPDYIKQGTYRGIIEGRYGDLLYAYGFGWRQFGTAGIRNQAVNSEFKVLLDKELEEFAKDPHAPILTGPNMMNSVTLLQQVSALSKIIIGSREKIEAMLKQGKDLTAAANELKIDKEFAQNIIDHTATIGYDSRLNGAYFGHLLAAAFLRNGIKVNLFDNPSGVPAGASVAKGPSFFGELINEPEFAEFKNNIKGSAFGVLISASHSEAEYNGFKAFLGYQKSQVDAATKDIIMNARAEVQYSEMNIDLDTGSMEDLNNIFRGHKADLTWLGLAERLPQEKRDYCGAKFVPFYPLYFAYLSKRSPIPYEKLTQAQKGAVLAAKKELQVLYTAFFGVGAEPAANFPGFYRAMGYENMDVVDRQTKVMDGRFPGHTMPDPGVVEGWMSNLYDYMMQIGGADLSDIDKAVKAVNSKEVGTATDPDVDRAGMMLSLEPGQEGNVRESFITWMKENLKGVSPAQKERIISTLQKELKDKWLLTANDAWTFMAYYKLKLLDQYGLLDKNKTYVLMKSHVTTDGLEKVAEYYRNKGYNVYVVNTYVGFTELAKKGRDLFAIASTAWEINKLLEKGLDIATQLETLKKQNEVLKQNVPYQTAGVPLIEEAIKALTSKEYEKAKSILATLAHMEIVEACEESNGYGELGRYVPEKGIVENAHISEKDGGLALYEFLELLSYGKSIWNKSGYELMTEMMGQIGYCATDNQFLKYPGLTGIQEKTDALEGFEKTLAAVLQKAIDRGETVTLFNGKYTVEKVVIYRDKKYDVAYNGFPEEGIQLIIKMRNGSIALTTFRPSGTGDTNRDYNWIMGPLPAPGSNLEAYKNGINKELLELRRDFFGVFGRDTGYAALEKGKFYGVLTALKEAGTKGQWGIFGKFVDNLSGFTPAEAKMLATAQEFTFVTRQQDFDHMKPDKQKEELNKRSQAIAKNNGSWREYLASGEAAAYPKKFGIYANGKLLVEVPNFVVKPWMASLAAFVAGEIVAKRLTGAQISSEDIEVTNEILAQLKALNTEINSIQQGRSGTTVPTVNNVDVEIANAAKVLGMELGAIQEMFAASINKTMLLNDFAESVGIPSKDVVKNGAVMRKGAITLMSESGLAVLNPAAKAGYNLTPDFFSQNKLEALRQRLVASSDNPKLVDLTLTRIQRIIFNAVNANKFVESLAAGTDKNVSYVARQLKNASVFQTLVATWFLSNWNALTSEIHLGTASTLETKDFVVPSSMEFYAANGVKVEFSLPERTVVDARQLAALEEYQNTMVNLDMARGGYNYRGVGTRQTVQQFYEEYFAKEWKGKIEAFIKSMFPANEPLEAFVTNGIGANDQFMWSLVNMYNANRPANAPAWYHVTTAREFAGLYEAGKVKPKNTLFMDISRSGSTWEGVEVAIRSLDLGFNKRIAVANGSALAAIANKAAELGKYEPLIIGISPDIGGRNMHRKTSIYYTAQTVAGMFVPAMKPEEFAKLNNKFDEANAFSNPDTSLAVSAGKFLHGAMNLLGVEHIAMITNTEPLRLVATEWEQYIMEGSNKEDVISLGIHNIAEEPAHVLANLANSPAGKKTVGMAILDVASPNYQNELARVNAVKAAMPLMIFTINSGEGGLKGGISPNQQAAFDILWTDLVTVFTTLLRVDANSNPNVKVVRAYTKDRVAGWKTSEASYANSPLNTGAAELVVSYGNPNAPGLGTEGEQQALTLANAKEMGSKLASRLANEGMLVGRSRLNLFVGREDLKPVVNEMRSQTYAAELGAKFGWITQTAVFPSWSHKGLEANLAYSANPEKPLLANKTVNIFFNARTLGPGQIYNQPFNSLGIMGKEYEGINGATIHQTNEAMTLPNIKRMAEVSPTILLEFNEKTENVDSVLKVFYEAFIKELGKELASTKTAQTEPAEAGATTFDHTIESIMQSSNTGEYARKTAENLFKAEEARVSIKRHLIFVKSAIPSEQLATTTAINYANYCADYYNEMGGYTADIVDTYEEAVKLLAKNPDWDKTNTIVGLIDKQSLDRMTAELERNGMQDKTKLLPMETFDKDQFVPLKGFFDLMSVLVHVNRPLDRPDDQELRDTIRDLLNEIGVRDVDNLINALSVAAYFEDPIKFAKNFIIRLLPPTRAASPAELRERYNAAKKVVESL